MLGQGDRPLGGAIDLEPHSTSSQCQHLLSTFECMVRRANGNPLVFLKSISVRNSYGQGSIVHGIGVVDHPLKSNHAIGEGCRTVFRASVTRPPLFRDPLNRSRVFGCFPSWVRTNDGFQITLELSLGATHLGLEVLQFSLDNVDLLLSLVEIHTSDNNRGQQRDREQGEYSDVV